MSNTTKFPTPNLDAVGELTIIPARLHMLILRAVQADIALAVEAATKVPSDVMMALDYILESIESKSADDRADAAKMVRHWLESLTVVPKPEPAAEDKRCGTCAYQGIDRCLMGAVDCNSGVLNGWKKAGT